MHETIDTILTTLAEIKHFSLATVDQEGNPWVVALSLTVDDQLRLIWVSRVDTEHSTNIRRQPNVSACVFRKTEQSDEFGFYCKALAHEVIDLEELSHCLAARYSRNGKPQPIAAEILDISPFRLYVAEITEAWHNDSSHVKQPIDLDTTRERAKQCFPGYKTLTTGLNPGTTD